MNRPKFSIALSLVLMAGFYAAAFGMSDSEKPGEIYHPQISETRGPVMIRGAKYGVWESAEAGMLLLSGDVLKTEKGGFAKVQFASGTVEIYETTVMVVPSIGVHSRKKDIREVLVERGNVLFDINPLGVERGFEFRTKNVQGGVKGTLFTVSYKDGGTAVNVYRGEVEVAGLEGSEEGSRKLVAGEAVRVAKTSGLKEVIKFDPDGALENYSYGTPPGLDGRGLPSDGRANPENKGVRARGEGIGREKKD